jgi:hypothetical protein
LAEDAIVITKRAREMGFASSLGIIHDHSGQLKPLAEREMAVYREINGFAKSSYARLTGFQENLILGQPNDWSCRAGARYVYICEDGLVHYCSQQRGNPGIPLEDYTWDDFWREFNAKKSCAPYCTVSCVQKIAMLDNWRGSQSDLEASPLAR